MAQSKVLRSTLALLLALALFPALAFSATHPVSARAQGIPQPVLASATGSGQPDNASATVAGKDEVIYATLAADGTLKSAYVVNHFDITAAGQLSDFGDYQAVTNLSTTRPLAQTDRQVLVGVEQGDFYYEGTLPDAVLPWNISIAYELDGKPINPEALAGSSGHLELRIVTRPNPGVDTVFYDNYVLQIQLALDTNNARNVVAPDATIAQAGSARQVVFTALPGKEADLRLVADVTDFEMTSIQISALPFSMPIEMPDVGEMADGLGMLADAVGLINEGARLLDAGAAEMSSGGSSLAAGSQSFNSGLAALSAGSQQLRDGSAQFNQLFDQLATQITEAYNQLKDGLGNAGIDIDQLTQNLVDLQQILTDLDSLMVQIEASRTDIDAAILTLNNFVNAFVGLDSATIAQLESELPLLSSGSQSTVQILLTNYYLSQTLADNWSILRPTLEGLSAALASLDTDDLQQVVGSLKDLLSELDGALGDISSLGDLVGMVEQLAGGYSQFNAGLISYTKGLDSIAIGYVEFNSGILDYMGGVESLSGGTSQLYYGTNLLYTNVADLPITIQEQIDALMADYDFGDFQPTSFVSTENTNIALVQFVLFTDPIALQVPEADAEVPDKPQTFWDRILALFA
jgi:X-X-X-Leu-X-X-Gly heptad repeat protein